MFTGSRSTCALLLESIIAMSKRVFAGDLSGLPGCGLAIVGFSGGADSTALAHWLAGQIDRERILLVHVNHMLRGEEAERDEAAAREFARRTGLRFVVSQVNVAALAKERGMGLEECGRAVRYELFASLAENENDRILTAHNANDNAETLLLNLCRGTGLDGLCGIPYQRGNIIRPLLKVSRAEIEEYCRENELSFVTDSSNLSTEYSRNKIRLEVLPILTGMNPRFVESASQTAELLTGERDCLRTQAETLLKTAKVPYGLDAAKLLSADKALISRALRLWLEKNGCGRLEKKHIEDVLLCLKNGGAVQVSGGVTVRRAQGILSAAKEVEVQPFCVELKLPEEFDIPQKISLPCEKTLILEKKRVNLGKSGQKIHNLLFKNAFDYDIITNTLVARTRREGDRFSRIGSGHTKSLKQVFQECGMPAQLRAGAVLLEADGVLAWCEGAGVSEKFRVTERTEAMVSVSLI